MASHFSVIRYVPDPIADERVNIGVVVTGTEGVRLRFLSRWTRVRQFGDESVQFLKEFANSLQEQQRLNGLDPAQWTTQRIKDRSERWLHSIQFSEPRPSMRTVDELFNEVVTRFLREPAEVVAADAARRTRNDAKNLTVRSVSQAVRERLGRQAVADFVKRNHPIRGREATHHFDIAIGNGRVLCAAQAVSLELEPRDAERDIDAAGWSVEALRAVDRNLPTYIIGFDRQAQQLDAAVAENRVRAQAVANQAGATLVLENDLEQWAATAAAMIHH